MAYRATVVVQQMSWLVMLASCLAVASTDRGPAALELPKQVVQPCGHDVPGPHKACRPYPKGAYQQPFPPMKSPFPDTYSIAKSTMIQGAQFPAGWLNSSAAAKYGFFCVGWGNNEKAWLNTTDRMSSSCDASMLEQARLIAAEKTGTRTMVYRNTFQVRICRCQF